MENSFVAKSYSSQQNAKGRPISRLAKLCRCRIPAASYAVLFVFLFATASTFAQANFEASLDRDKISIGESATLTVTVENGNLQSQISPHAVAGLQYGPQSSSDAINIINGNMTNRHEISMD